ncbi:unnamed protein product [Merluccius merluccius]
MLAPPQVLLSCTTGMWAAAAAAAAFMAAVSTVCHIYLGLRDHGFPSCEPDSAYPGGLSTPLMSAKWYAPPPILIETS